MSHNKSGKGSWAGNRDRHEKKQKNRAREKSSWTDMGKKTNSERNQKRGIVEQVIDSLLGIKKR